MKSYAYYFDEKTCDEKIISAFEAIAIREYTPQVFENISFYYKYNNKKHKVIPKLNSKTLTAFFAFDKGSPFSEGSGGETLAHYAAKKALCSMKKLHLVDGKNDFELTVIPSSACCEKELGGGEYFADVFIEFDKSSCEPREYFYKWDGAIALEIKVSHAVDEEKRSALERLGIPIFEIYIKKQLKNTVEYEAGKSIDKAVNQMKRIFSKAVYGSLISNPETKEYKIMCKYKEEIEQFKAARDKAEKEYLEAKEKADKMKNEQRRSALYALFHKKDK